MRRGIRTRAAWMAVGIVLGGATFALAANDVALDRGKVPETTPPAVAEENKAEAKVKADAAKDKGRRAGAERTDEGRKLNHGYYVSRAAHCENVPGFDAPADCDSNGAAHGEYVSSVAQSDLGKPEGAGED